MLEVLVLGTTPAHLLSKGSLPFLRLPSVFVELPIVMPPAVAALALLFSTAGCFRNTGYAKRKKLRGVFRVRSYIRTMDRPMAFLQLAFGNSA